MTIVAVQEAHAEKLAAEDAYENARTQQEADRAQAAIRAAAAALKAALAIKKPSVPELEPINEDAIYFKVRLRSLLRTELGPQHNALWIRQTMFTCQLSMKSVSTLMLLSSIGVK